MVRPDQEFLINFFVDEEFLINDEEMVKNSDCRFLVINEEFLVNDQEMIDDEFLVNDDELLVIDEEFEFCKLQSNNLVSFRRAESQFAEEMEASRWSGVV